MEKYLVDTNIFIEILLEQERTDDCKKFLSDKKRQLFISDFSLHSVGVILFRLKKSRVFAEFATDVLSSTTLLSLPKSEYSVLTDLSSKHRLDFDDAYQLAIANSYKLSVATLDKDFKKAAKDFNVLFL